MSKFNPKQYIIRIKGGDYLPVAARLIWFREEHPDWSIETEPLVMDLEHGVAVFRATVRDNTGRILAQATKMETRQQFPDFVEKSETGALGRALAMCGFGTQFTAHEFDEGDRIVDTPYHASNAVQDEHERPAQNCTECGVTLTNGQHQFSTQRYGRPLCPRCQKQASTIAK